MSEIGEALGTVAEGSLLARAVEPAAGDAGLDADGHTHESRCLNCATPLAGPHCHGCGQRAHVHRTLGAFAHDLLHGVLHFEGKTWRTLPLLAWRPGQLTREYIDGRRARYVSPIALFLFVVFLSFAVFNLIGSGANAPAVNLDQVRMAHADNAAKIAALRAEQSKLPAGPSERQKQIDEDLAELTDDQKGIEMVLRTGGDSAASERSVIDDFWEGFSHDAKPGGGVSDIVDKVRANPQLAIYKAQTNAYKYSWALIPLSVPFVWLLFPFSRRFGAYDHTVFATYSITFMIALVAVLSLLFYVGWDAIGALLLLYAPFHMFRQLRGTYHLSRWGAAWRMLALSLFAWIVIALFAAVIASLG